jgi:hypothetical protein
MLEDAHIYGYPMTESLFDDWIERGLLGSPHRTGLGRGRGSSAQWPSEQFTLLLELLRGRQQGKLRIGQLCALPVWRWVYWRELGGVALPQVRRAMETWATSVQKTTADVERKDVRQAVAKLQATGAPGRRALLKELTAVGAFLKEPDPELLRYHLEAAITDSPIRLVMRNGKSLSSDIEMLATMFPVREMAFQNYEEQIAPLPDPLWEWARTFLLYIQRLRQEKQPVLARNRRLADRYRRVTVYSMMWDACYDLLAPLSIAAQHLFPEEQRDPIPFLNPQVWREERVNAVTETTLVHSSLLLPDGSPVAYLRYSVRVVYKEKGHAFTLDLPFL